MFLVLISSETDGLVRLLLSTVLIYKVSGGISKN